MGGDISVDDAKRDMRKAARTRRSLAYGAAADMARLALQASGLDFLDCKAPCAVSGFQPYQEEIDCTGLLARLGDEGWTTCLPEVLGAGQPLQFRAWRSGDRLVPGVWDIPVPAADCAVVLPDVLLVPLLAFDAAGYRLGYGGGFYDRSLEELRHTKTVTAVGVAFSGQEVERVPRDAHDQPLDWLLTENGPMKCGEQ
jgi:5-formyltetrahydrofolate cyclo-ligase